MDARLPRRVGRIGDVEADPPPLPTPIDDMPGATPSARFRQLKATQTPPEGARWTYPPHQGERQRVRNLKRLVKSGSHWQCRGCGAVHAFATVTPILTGLGATCPGGCR